jgi:hypothetical protein
MHVVWHQAVRPNVAVEFAAPFDQQRKIRSIVVVAEERLQATVTSLRDVQRQARNHDSR